MPQQGFILLTVMKFKEAVGKLRDQLRKALYMSEQIEKNDFPEHDTIGVTGKRHKVRARIHKKR